MKVLDSHEGKLANEVIVLTNWPSRSPDLSPIDNLQAHVRQKHNAYVSKTFWKYQTVLRELKAEPQHITAFFLASMTQRMD